MSFLDNPQLVYNWTRALVKRREDKAWGDGRFKYVVDGEEHELYIHIEHGHGSVESSFMADHSKFTVRIEKAHMFYFKGTYESIHDYTAFFTDLNLITDKYATKKFRKTTFWWAMKDFKNTLDHHLMILTLLINETV